MIIVGLTGGIGSGKTTVANEFAALGIPVYIADVEAKKLMQKSKIIKRKLIQLFGSKAYIDDALNKPFIADKIFNNTNLLEKMNAIIHPRVAKHFNKWVLNQSSSYIIKEVAILFENNKAQFCDYVITVTTPKALRIKRLLNRNQTTKEKINAIIKNQWSDEDKIVGSHYTINNIDIDDTKGQVLDIHNKILKKHTTNLKF